jgi:hypothetical protein
MSRLNPRIPFDSKRIGGGDYANSLRLSLFRERTGQRQFVNTNIHPVFQSGGCDVLEVFQEYLNVRCFRLRFWIDYRHKLNVFDVKIARNCFCEVSSETDQIRNVGNLLPT